MINTKKNADYDDKIWDKKNSKYSLLKLPFEIFRIIDNIYVYIYYYFFKYVSLVK